MSWLVVLVEHNEDGVEHFADVTPITHPAPLAPKPTSVPVHLPAVANSVVVPTSHVSCPTIAIVNLSTVATDAEIINIMNAIQIQIDRDFAPIWATSANLIFLPKTATIPANNWVVQILDTSDQQGALGYHETTASGMPIGKIFAKSDAQYNLSLSVTMSHEILECLADPLIDLTVFAQTSNTEGTLVAYESCDAVESDELGYKINGVLVSDFVTPAFFETSNTLPAGTKYDFCGHLTAPLSIAPGGYLSTFAVNPTTTGWTQQTNGEMGPRLKSKIDNKDARLNKRANKR
ncbi:unnamed protein product [Sphagnum tenellum]